ncbi:MAG: hypothetical protein BGO78_05075 [Chloroflexi bacterium 44-23]|nr:MAG: hypothetical protein BGO78_05075 [Chloroflexi bacterium 44-23]
MQVFLVFALLIALLAVIFAVQNTALVTVSFFVWDFNNSLAIVLLLTLFTGVLISILMSTPGWFKHKITLTNARKKIKELESKLVKVETQYQAAQQELQMYKETPAPSEPVAPVTPMAPVVAEPGNSEPPSSPQNPGESSLDEPPTAMLPDLDEPLPGPTPAKEPVKKSKFPGIDRILNR